MKPFKKIAKLYNKFIIEPLVNNVISKNKNKPEEYVQREIVDFQESHKDDHNLPELTGEYEKKLRYEMLRTGTVVDDSIARAHTRTVLNNLGGSLIVAASAAAVTGTIFAPAAPLVFAGIAIHALGTAAYKYLSIHHAYNGRMRGATRSIRATYEDELSKKRDASLEHSVHNSNENTRTRDTEDYAVIREEFEKDEPKLKTLKLVNSYALLNEQYINYNMSYDNNASILLPLRKLKKIHFMNEGEQYKTELLIENKDKEMHMSASERSVQIFRSTERFADGRYVGGRCEI